MNYDECATLLMRARDLMVGRTISTTTLKGACDMKWDFAQAAMIRAAAVLAAAAVNHMADDLDQRDALGLTDEELDEALKDMEPDPPTQDGNP